MTTKPPDHYTQDQDEGDYDDNRTGIILRARREALRDGDLDFGARCLFCLLLDLSLSRYTQRADGVVCISVTKLSEELKCAARTIYEWKKQLEEKRFIWVTEQRMPNMWPLNTYHVSALDSPNEPHQLPTRDGTWGNGARRSRPETSGDGARSLACKKQHATGRVTTLNCASLAQNAGATGSPAQASAAKLAAGSRKVLTGEPQNLRLGTAKSAAGSGKTPQLPAAKKNMPRPQQTAVNRESIAVVSSHKETSVGGEGAPTPSRAAWERKLGKMFDRELRGIKADLLKQQREADQSDNAMIADISLRIEAVDRALYGGDTPKRKQPRPAATAKAAPKAAPTQEEILEGAKYLVSIGKGNLLTAGQREALARV
jgi:hypothetical protein